MSPSLAEECHVLQVATALLQEEHERLLGSGQPREVLDAHAERLRVHRQRVRDFSERLHAEHVRREPFFPEAAGSSDPGNESERYQRARTILSKHSSSK